MKSRRKRVALAAALVGGSVLAATAFLLRSHILEVWHLRRLESADGTVRLASLRALEQVASGRSVPALLRIVEEDGDEVFRTRALDALLAASPRMHPSQRRDAALALRDRVTEGEAIAEAYRRLARECPNLYATIVGDLEGSDTALRALAASILIEAWPRSKSAVFSFAANAAAPDLLGFLALGFGCEDAGNDEPRPRQKRGLQGLQRLNPGRQPIPGTDEAARALLYDHERPEARATALSFLVGSHEAPKPQDLALLREVYDADPSPLVRIAVLRLAGYMGNIEGTLDLAALWRSEPDPGLRAEALLARDLWSYAHRKDALELWDGAVTTWVAYSSSRPETPWTEDEIDALEGLLLEEEEQDLRDAASMALAGRLRRFLDGRNAPARPDLKVHEWSLIRRDDAAPGKALLPDFPEVPDEKEATPWQQLNGDLVVSHAAISFDGSSPTSLLVRMEPWHRQSFQLYPQCADTFGSRPGLDAPPVESEEEGTGDNAGTWRKRQQLSETATKRHVLDWCGLRCGYPEKVEPTPASVSPSSLRDILRRASSKQVAFRGKSERFLHYGGALNIASPWRAFREEGSSHLLLTVRRLDELPCAHGKDPLVLSPIPAVLIVEKRPGLPARAKTLKNLDGDTPPCGLDLQSDLGLEGEAILEELEAVLVHAGLTRAEAESLIVASKRELLETDGLRLAWLLPRWLHDRLMQVTVLPRPGELVRVGLVVEEVATASATSGSAEDRALRWEFEPGVREEAEAEFHQGTVPPLTSVPLRLTDGALDGMALDLSSDGSRVLLFEEEAHYLADMDELRLIPLAPLGTPKSWSPSLSEDGGSVAFSSWQDERWLVHAADLERKTMSTIRLDLHTYPRTSLSGNGLRLAVSGGDGIHVIDLERRDTWFLRVGTLRDSVILISGDGRRGAFIRVDATGDEDVVLVDLDTGATLDVSRSARRDFAPSISTDGNRIAFVRSLDGAIWVADLEARSRTRVSPPGSMSQFPTQFPSLSPDGRHIAFSAEGRNRVRDLRTDRLTDMPGPSDGLGIHVSNGGKRVVYTIRQWADFRAYLGRAGE